MDDGGGDYHRDKCQQHYMLSALSHLVLDPRFQDCPTLSSFLAFAVSPAQVPKLPCQSRCDLAEFPLSIFSSGHWFLPPSSSHKASSPPLSLCSHSVLCTTSLEVLMSLVFTLGFLNHPLPTSPLSLFMFGMFDARVCKYSE